jgi:adenylate cyclase class IV
LQDGKSQLIYYERPVESGPKLSDYHVTFIENPEALKLTLDRVCGTKGSVRKHRMLYMVGQTRVHCDRVDELGDFMELEVSG